MPGSAGVACVLAWEGTCRAHVVVGRQWASALPGYEGEDAVVDREDVDEKEAVVVVAVDEGGPLGAEGAQTRAVSAADTELRSGEEDEAAGWRLARVWDAAAIHRGVSLLLTMMGQSTSAVACCRAALGP